MELNIKKIEKEMKRLKLTKAGLARELGISRQAVEYYFKSRPISKAEMFGRFFNISPKDFIK